MPIINHADRHRWAQDRPRCLNEEPHTTVTLDLEQFSQLHLANPKALKINTPAKLRTHDTWLYIHYDYDNYYETSKIILVDQGLGPDANYLQTDRVYGGNQGHLWNPETNKTTPVRRWHLRSEHTHIRQDGLRDANGIDYIPTGGQIQLDHPIDPKPLYLATLITDTNPQHILAGWLRINKTTRIGTTGACQSEFTGPTPWHTKKATTLDQLLTP